MEEKIKIYVPANVYQILLKDMELFEFFKKDRSLNKNEFLNRLVLNYYETYARNSSRTYDFIKNCLDELGINSADASSAATSISEYALKQALDLENKKMDVVISIKPTKLSSKAFDYIESFLLNGSSFSGWIRNLLASYVMLPQDKREHIIFKDTFEVIEEALDKNRMLYFISGSTPSAKHYVHPYALSSSKEELFNYLLAQEYGKPFSFRISRMYNAAVMNEECNIPDESIAVFNRMIQFGPQFSYSLDETEPIKVRLTERGMMMYEKIYLHRPAYSSTDGNIYTFECSINQAFQYFQRFGKNAIVISPLRLTKDFEKYYDYAYNKYRKQVKNAENSDYKRAE